MEEKFIKSAEIKINSIINDLGWSIDYFLAMKPMEMVSCPNNSAHRLPPETLETHLESCNWTSAGYRKYDLPLAVNTSCNSYVQLTTDLQEKIISEAELHDDSFEMAEIAGARSKPREIPMTSSRLTQNFTRDERRAIYDYVIANTESSVKIPVSEPVSEPKAEEKRELTTAEILAAERDAKRRRATYRNKVHTNRKTHVEIMREVIDSQMNCLIDDPNESSNSTQNMKVETNRKESDDQKNMYRKPSHKTHHSSRSDRRDNYKESSDHNSSRSIHRSRSDRRYNDDDRNYYREPEKGYSNRSSFKRRHDDTDRWLDERKKTKHDTRELEYHMQEGHGDRRNDLIAVEDPKKDEQKISLEYLKDVIKNEKKRKKEKHKKHKKKKKKHKRKHSSSSSSDSD